VKYIPKKVFKYIREPEPEDAVEAIQYLVDTSGVKQITEWMRDGKSDSEVYIGSLLFGKGNEDWLLVYEYIETPDSGDWFTLLKPGDWILRDITGGSFSCVTDTHFKRHYRFAYESTVEDNK